MGHPLRRRLPLICRLWGPTAALAACLLLASSVFAFDGPELRLVRRTIHIPERGEVTGYTIHYGTNRFTVTPPQRWRVTANQKEENVVFNPRDYSSNITMELKPWNTNAPSGSTNIHRDRLLAKIPDGSIVREFRMPTGVGEGTAFDLERVGKSKAKVSVRHVAVPTEGLLITFTLTAPTGRFDKATFPFGVILTSFKTASPANRPPDVEEK